MKDGKTPFLKFLSARRAIEIERLEKSIGRELDAAEKAIYKMGFNEGAILYNTWISKKKEL